MRRVAAVAACVATSTLIAALAPGASAATRHHAATTPAPTSLWPAASDGSRPGPAILYRAPATQPELTNAGIWKAAPTLVSGTEAYRRGEFLYQDFLYDDHGAQLTADPLDPRGQGDTFSKPNGTLTYPTGPGYSNNAADLVEFRVKPTSAATAFRITLNTLENPSLVAFSIAIGGRPGRTYAFPDGANVVAPARLFLTVHPHGGRLVADLVHAGTDAKVKGAAPTVRVDRARRQITVTVPHRDWNPYLGTVRLAMGVGLWNAASNRYLLPGPTASATQPGGAGLNTHPAAFFNVAFRTHEPLPSVTEGITAVTNAAWWRDRDQGAALARGDLSDLSAEVDFGRLARRVTDDSGVPRSGLMDRILSSHYEPAQGATYAHECGFQGAFKPSACQPELTGGLQPYAIDVPTTATARSGYGLTLLLHSLSANYNQYIGSHNQSQFADRSRPSIVITPEARGPDQFYEGLGAADVFEVWADVARRYHLDPAYTDLTGYSMGGIGTFKFGAQYPDLFARAQPTVGEETNNDVLASFRNLPVLMWNNSGDELVNPVSFEGNASKLASLGYRYELDTYEPCPASPSPQKCSPLFPNHLELAVNDQYAPAAAFLGTATVNPDPAHVTYVYDTARNRPTLGMTADHAYWLSRLTLRTSSHTSYTGDPEGQIDALSLAFGQTDPAATAATPTPGALTGGNLGPLAYLRTATTWGAAGHIPAADTIHLTATNIATAAIDVARAHTDCHVTVDIVSDGPITVTLPRCGRTLHSAGTGSGTAPLPLPVSPGTVTTPVTGGGRPAPPWRILPPGGPPPLPVTGQTRAG